MLALNNITKLRLLRRNFVYLRLSPILCVRAIPALCSAGPRVRRHPCVQSGYRNHISRIPVARVLLN